MLQAFISILFFMTFSAYLFLGIYSLSIDVKAVLNRAFFLVCIAFSIWTIAFAVENSAGTCEEALLWRRVSALGWSTAYSIILHFILILAEKRRLLKTKWIYFALYLPAAISVFGFSLYSETANNQYALVKTAAGWAFIPSVNFLDLFFNCYYIGFSLIGFGILYFWGKNTSDLVKKKHSRYLLISSGIAVLLGSITDSIVNRFLDVKIPSLAPIIIMIPMITILFIIRRYGLLDSEEKKIFTDEGIILGDQSHSVFFKYIAGVFYIGSMLNLLHYFLYPAQLSSVILFSTSLLIIGAAIFLLPYCPWKREAQDDMLAVIIALSIPLVLFRFLENYASNIVWPIPLVFMMIMAVFNKRRMLVIVAASGVITGILSWISMPDLAIQVTSIDYVSRIVIYGMGIILTIYINKIYINRLAENKTQVRFQKMISEISTDFITVTASNYNDKINDMLERSGKYFCADRSQLYLFSEDFHTIKKHNEWRREGIALTRAGDEEISVVSFSWWMKQTMLDKAVFVSDPEGLPHNAHGERELLFSKGIKCMLTVPVTDKERVIGVITFDGVKDKKNLSEMDREQLKVLTNTLADAAAKVEAEREINYLAYNDPLTRLPNRAYFKYRLEQELYFSKQSGNLTGVMLIDLDGFKEVNDSLGHEWGDYVLMQVAERLSDIAGENEVVARFGGDEFLIMISQASDIEAVQNAADKMMETFKELVAIKEQEFFITASGGIAVFPIDGESVETLIKHADLAMYSSKNKGKNQFSFCSAAMKEDIINKMQLTNSLYKAMDNDELELYYQPQVNLKTQEIIGLEALIRWNHPTLGRIPPSVFIPLAEQNGLITQMGTWVLKTACRQNKIWQDMSFRPIRMAVNLSIDQFRGGNLRQVVNYTLKETGLDPSCLELEITEGIAMKEGDLIISTLRELREMGVEISIDDFGMAYSSLSRLKDLPADRLKIDMLFVQGISPGSKDNSIIEIIIHLARSLGLKVTAEGVETESQLDFLIRKDCDDAQGYYYYKPMPAKEVEMVLKKAGNKTLMLAEQNN